MAAKFAGIHHDYEHEQPLYDVFLCFRGCDTRQNFTGNLLHALRCKRFKVFMYSDILMSGNDMAWSILRALQQSRISIVVFSQNFADSMYCLNELVEILNCKNTKNQQILPIFYEVDPSEVRCQSGRYGESIAALEDRLRFVTDSAERAERLQMFKSALSEVASISGKHFKNGCLQKFEYEFIQEIVEWVSNTLPRYDVFISFNNEDTGYSFSSYLYNALDQKGFKIFMKDNICEKDAADQQRSQSVITAIEKSRLSIIVLSENYAYSSSCLDELVTILEFMKKNNQLLVWPIFYKVDPSDIRHQKNSHSKAMNEHENKLGKDSDKVKVWRSALFEVANLKGWHLKYGYEYELVEKIVETAIKI